MIKKISLLLLLAILLFNCSENKTLDELLITLETDKIAMGTVSVYKSGNEIYNKSFGLKNIETKEKANEKTRYWIGSITKTYTATVILQLVDEAKIRLNTTLDTYFPNIPNAKKITISHLLQHRSGLFNITNNPDFEVWIAEPRSRDQMLARIKQYDPQFQPGEKASYSNTNFIILSYIAEDIEGMTFKQILNNRIFKPLQLKRTSFADTLNLANNEAMDYFPENGEWSPIVYQTNLTGTMGAGGIISTAKEVNIFYQSLFSGELISEASLKAMTTEKDELGLGIGISKYKGFRTYGHDGSIDGFRSIVVYNPEEKLSIALTFNCSKVAMTSNLKRVFDAYNVTFND